MSWSYSGNPQGNRLDRIRALIGDTNPNEPLLDNEIILWLMERSPNDFAVASQACSIIATRLSREADLEVGDLSLKLSKLAENYRAAALDFAAKAQSAWDVGTPIWTSSRTQPLFKVKQFDREV